MTLKQRHTPFDHFLLQVVFPMVADTPLSPCIRLARMWHAEPPKVPTAREVIGLPRAAAPAVELVQAA